MSRVRDFFASQWQYAAAVLTLAHTAILLLYCFGFAVSRVPFTDAHVQTAATSPIVPAAHALAGALIVVGLIRPRWRDQAAVASFATWFGYAAVLTTSALLRHPPLGLPGAALSASFAILAVGAVIYWNDDELAD